jgi:prepilin-type N-terminal cleavage/methylation domain-containing protein
MIHSKSLNKSGFTFIELILAVTMIGICITAIFTLQTNLLTSVAERADAIRRVLYTKNLLYEYLPSLNPETVGKAQTKKVEDPAMQVVLQAKPIPEKSKLHQFQYVYTVSGNATWERNGITYNQTLLTFALIPPEKKEEKK